MKFWNKRNRIEFFHSEPSIVENFPIIESKQLKLKWVKKAREDITNLTEDDSAENKFVNSHVSRCPGIFNLFKYGYVICLHKDIIITNNNGTSFNWNYRFRSQYSKENLEDTFAIAGLDQSGVDMLPKPPWAANFIIRIQTGWNVIAPKGIKFIMLPIAYPDTYDFTATTGILNPAVSTEVNFQMFWNTKDKETLILAGTPLGHLIPLSEKKYQMVQRIMNQHDQAWVAKFQSLLGSSFRRAAISKKMVDMYNKHWKR